MAPCCFLNKICHDLAEPYTLPLDRGAEMPTTVQHHCTASIGVALFGYDGVNPEHVFRDADRAMYQAKSAGGNRVQCYGLVA